MGRGPSALRSPPEHTFEHNGCSKVCFSRMPTERSSVRLPRMCGIVGYVGSRPALSIVLDGLRRLEYRGYDSAGVAVVDDGTVLTEKKAGKLANLEKALAERADAGIPTGSPAMGHPGGATHGGPTARTAPPHLPADGRVAVTHNGILENFARLRRELEATG